MRVSTVSSATSLAFTRRNKQRNYEYHPPITYDTNKVRKTLLCLAGIGIAGLTVALIKDAGNNSVKTAFNTVKEAAKEVMPDPMIIAVGNRRDSLGVKRYNVHTAKTKLKKLKAKIQNGEFKNLPEHALKDIEKQRAALIKQCTQKI
ncbi:MAG: hypothetical protein IJY61_05565 [Candidatus Gastranaerophilales bacterium]|nr:hypothetical protein [Candidatus Gastranaerophilales bacterium]